MAHFAKINSEKKVLAVHVLNNSDMLDGDGVEDETVGQQYLQLHNNWPAPMWIQTSYNTLQNKHNSGDNSKAFRGNYAGIGHTWDEDNNIFWPKKPYASWVKDTSDPSWHSPIGDAPDLGAESETHHYEWNESDQSWDKTANLT